ncbi:MAG: hypothetical protein J7J92_03165, partial [Candidatus Aenigmarchaeota archaeon]|nr:hypothetical protein [Candidatus Aenigmarchaeota archaeon]
WSYVNVTISDTNDVSGHIDFDNSLVGWWRFEGNYNDSSTYGNDGSCTNCPTLTNGKRGQAYEFDGSDDYVEVASSSSLGVGTEGAIEVWAKMSNWNTVVDNELVNNNIVYTSDNSIYLSIHYSVGLHFRYGGTGQTGNKYLNYQLSDNWAADSWHHMAAIWKRDGTTTYLYLYADGAQVDSDTTTLEISLSSSAWNIGKYLVATHQEFFNGTIDEVRIWNRALSPEEINASYNAGLHRLEHNFTDLAEGNHNFTAYAVDAAGNKNNTETRTITVDTTGPNAPTGLSPANDTYTNNASITFSWTAPSDVGCSSVSEYNWSLYSDASCSVLNETNLTSNTNITKSLSSGTYYWRVRATDALGNAGQWSSCLKLVVDLDMPSVSFVEPTPTNGEVTIGNSVTINITASDSQTSIDSCVLEWNGVNESFTSHSGNNWWSSKSVTDGVNYTINAYCNDTAGNVGEAGERWFIENYNPIITSVTTNVSSVYREQPIQIRMNGTDSDNAKSTLTAKISIKPDSGSWYIINDTMTYDSGQDWWTYNYTPSASNVTTTYTVQIFLTDPRTEYDSQTNTSLFEVLNYVPNITNIYTNTSVVLRGQSIRIYCDVSDTETAEENMTVKVSVKHWSVGAWNAVNNATMSWDGSDHYYDWTVPSDYSDGYLGYHDVECYAEDADGGTDTRRDEDEFKVKTTVQLSNASLGPPALNTTLGYPVGGWGELFNFTVSVYEPDGDNVTIYLWDSSDGVTWSLLDSQICTDCSTNKTVNFTSYYYECNDVGTSYFKLNATDDEGSAETPSYEMKVEQNDLIQDSSIMIAQGNGSTVATRGLNYLNISLRFKDADRNVWVGDNVNGTIWVSKSNSQSNFDNGWNCNTNSTGHCTIKFDPNCDYSEGIQYFTGGVNNDACYKSTNMTGYGVIYIDRTGSGCEYDVAFEMTYAIGAKDDTITVSDNQITEGYYTSSNATKYYVSSYDPATDSIFGIVSAGNRFYYMDVSQGTSTYTLKMSQEVTGNKFVIPVTTGNSSVIADNMPESNRFKLIRKPFAYEAEGRYPVVISTEYPGINFVGNIRGKGRTSLVFEKEVVNDTVNINIK